MKEYIVDSCVLVGFLFKEHSFFPTKTILSRAFEGEIKLVISSIIWGEIYFTACREMPKDEVKKFLDDLENNYNVEIATPTFKDCMQAAEYKTSGGIAYFDCFNLVLANKYPKAAILTLDKEYEKFKDKFRLEFL